MSHDAAEILKETLALPIEARDALADSLLESVESEVDEDAESAWQCKIARRVAEVDSGAVTPIPWGGGPVPPHDHPSQMSGPPVEFHPEALAEADASRARFLRSR